jgi:tetratricopeptide (TPR) repeat protein
LYQHALQLRTKKLGAEDASIARVYGDLADLFDVWDQHERSIEYALKACTVLHKHLPGAFDEFYGPLRKLTVFSKKLAQAPRRRMGELLTETGILTEQKLQGALQHAKQEGKPLGSVLKEDGYIAEQELQSVLSAQLLMKEGVLPEEIAVEALKVARKMNMPLRAVIDHFKLLAAATDDDTLAELVMEQDRLLAAENGLGVNHPDVGTIAFHLAEKYYQRNRLADAEVFLKRALAIDALTHALQVDLVGSACERLAQIYKATGRELLAAPLLMRALECLSKTGQSESERGSRILLMAAEVEMSQKNYMVALSFLRSVQALQDKRQEEVSLRIPVLEKLGACYMELDQVEQAEPILARAAELKKQSSS